VRSCPRPLAACASGPPVPPAYTQEELAERCIRTGGWWHGVPEAAETGDELFEQLCLLGGRVPERDEPGHVPAGMREALGTPAPTGSVTCRKTTGISLVAAFAAERLVFERDEQVRPPSGQVYRHDARRGLIGDVAEVELEVPPS
jgi:hypothetical protein